MEHKVHVMYFYDNPPCFSFFQSRQIDDKFNDSLKQQLQQDKAVLKYTSCTY